MTATLGVLVVGLVVRALGDVHFACDVTADELCQVRWMGMRGHNTGPAGISHGIPRVWMGDKGRR